MKPVIVDDGNTLYFCLIVANGRTNPILHLRELGSHRVLGGMLTAHEKRRALVNAIETVPERRSELLQLAQAHSVQMRTML
jgi:hypothetical protein